MKGLLRIPQSLTITGTSPSDCLVPYPGYLLGVGSYPSAEVQSMYSTAPADWAKMKLNDILKTVNGFKYCYLTLIILFNIICSFSLTV